MRIAKKYYLWDKNVYNFNKMQESNKKIAKIT